MPKMKDSGKRQTFETGAVCDSDEGKSRPDLVSAFAMERLGHWLAAGKKKYGERNYEAGIPISRRFASLYRHLLQYQMGDHSEDHAAALMCNIMMIIHMEEAVRRGLLPPSLLDMPKYRRTSSYQETPKIVVTADGPKIKFEAIDEAIMRWLDDGGV
ncbi:MAG: DUF5664 domain-containing protein [Planctomycetaceae bacterium]|nr:DUF5664 domain-containing protein [Planctomycetaceae bacterium]